MAELNNPYSDLLTSGGLAAEELIDDLADSPDESEGLPVGPSPDSAPFITNAEYEAERRKYYENADVIVKATDQHVITVLGEINTLKQQIAQLTVEAFNNVDDGEIEEVGQSNEWVESNKLAETSTDIVSEIGNGDPWIPFIIRGYNEISYGGYKVEVNPGPGVTTETRYLTGLTGIVNHDYVAIYKYPVLENEDFTSRSYIDGNEGWIFLTEGQVGVGNPQKYSYDQQDSTTQEIEETITPSGISGTFYCWQNKSKMNNALSGSGDDVAAKLLEIKQKREDLLSYIEGTVTGSNILRDARFKYQRELWIELRSQNAENTGSVDPGEVYGALTDIEKQEDISLYNG